MELSEITAIDVRVGKRGKRQTMEFSGVRAQKEIDAYKAEMKMTSAEMKQNREETDVLATMAKSYAVGGTGTRSGEDTDNVKYYAKQATGVVQDVLSAAASAESAKDTVVAAQTAAAESEANAKTYAEQASTAQAAAKNSETNAKTSETNAAASEANAKVYAEQAESAASGVVAGVSSFNGRSGAVTPQSGDYSYDMISGTPTIPSYSNATKSAAGLMSASDKSKLDGIETGANKTTVDSARSESSSNPLSNSVVSAALTAVENRATDLESKTTTAATSSAMGMMSAEDKSKLDGIAEGATKIVVDSTLDKNSANSENPVQAKALFSSFYELYAIYETLYVSLDTVAHRAGISYSGTLAAGNTSMQLSISDALADADLIDVYASIYGVSPTSVVASGNTITLTFPAQTSAMDVCVVIKQFSS